MPKTLAHVSKALAGALAAGLGGTGTAAVAVPEGVLMPWWGYVLVAVLNAAIGFAGVYAAPANRSPAAPIAAPGDRDASQGRPAR
jgi:hypothetical protein